MAPFATPRERFDDVAESYRRARRHATVASPPGLSVATVRALADAFEPAWVTDEASADAAVYIAGLTRTELVDVGRSLKMLLQLVAVRPHRADAYHRINEIYHQDVARILRARLLENALAAFAAPKEHVEPSHYAKSCASLGWLYGRLGLLEDARRAFTHAMCWHDPDAHRIAEYGLLELECLVRAARLDPASIFGPGDPDEGKPRVLIGTVLFGREYCDQFEAGALRTLFGPVNLAALAEHWRPALVVFAPAFEIMRLRVSKPLAAIGTAIPVSFVPFPADLVEKYPEAPPPGSETHPSMPYAVSSLAQLCMAELARRSGADLTIVPPDAVFSATTMATIARARQAGFEAVLAPGLRLARAGARRAIDEALRAEDSAGDIETRALTRIALDNLHPATRATFATDSKVTHPGQLIWPLRDGDGLRLHTFQLHPLFLARSAIARSYPRRMDSIDGNYVSTLFPTPEHRRRIRVLAQSDEIVMYETSPPSVPADRTYDVTDLVAQAGGWICSVMQPIHFWLFSHAIQIGADGKDREGPGGSRSHLVAELLKLEERIPHPNAPETASSVAAEARAQFDRMLAPLPDWDVSPPAAPDLPARAGRTPPSMRVILSIVVWGRQYVENFLNICLPSMLSPGNLADLPGGGTSKLVVHTRAVDRPLLTADPGMRRVAELIDVQYVDLTVDPTVSKYKTLSMAQSDCVQMSRDFDAIVFLYSDFVWARGALCAALARLNEGYEAVVSPVPPLLREEFTRRVLMDGAPRFRTDGGFVVLDFAPRELIGLGKPILHPMMRDNAMESEKHTGNPAYVLWTGPRGDYVIRCFHAHPVALRVRHRSAEYWRPFSNTLDEVFFPTAYSAAESIYVVADSDELAIVSLTEADFPTHYLNDAHRLDSGYVERWARACAAPTHRFLFERSTLWHEHDVDPVAWAPAITRSATFARVVTARLQQPEPVVEREEPAPQIPRREGIPAPIEAGGRTIKLLRVLAAPLAPSFKKAIVMALPTWLRAWVLNGRRRFLGRG